MKKVFIGVLAALMLFAFTACEPQTIAWPTDKDVSYLEIVQVKDFVYGEIPTKDGFNVIIHYTDGDPETVNGAVSITPTPSNGEYKVESQFDFDTDTKTVPTIGVETVKFETVTNVAITGVSNVTVVEKTTLSAIHDISTAVEKKVLSFSGEPVFTLSYEGGERSFTLADEKAGKFDYVLNVYEGTSTTPMATSATFEKGKTYTVKVASYELADGKPYAVTNSTVDFTITVTPAVQPNTTITRIAVEVVKDADVAEDKIEIISDPFIDEGEIAVLAYNSDNEIVDILSGTEYKTLGDSLEVVGNLPVAESALEGMIYLAANPAVSASYSIYGKDYIASIAVEKPSVTITAGDNYSISSVGKVTGTYASSSSKTVDVTSAAKTPVISIPETATATSSFLTTKVTYVNEKGETKEAPVTISVAAKG